MWLGFLEQMNVIELDHDEYVYEKGSKADSFFVIRKGSVEFMMSDNSFAFMPFLLTRDWFGEIELLNQTRRKWSVKSRGKTILY